MGQPRPQQGQAFGSPRTWRPSPGPSGLSVHDCRRRIASNAVVSSPWHAPSVAGSEWRDDAISSRREDAFGRTAYADRAAELIARSHTWDSSTVFGLTGSWGSGKTSLVAMIVESLKESHSD